MHVFQSVLQQQAIRNLKCECNFSSLQANRTGGLESSSGNSNGSRINEVENLDNNEKSSTSSLAQTPAANLLQQTIIKKQGVSGESCDANIIGCSSDILIRKFDKDFK